MEVNLGLFDENPGRVVLEGEIGNDDDLLDAVPEMVNETLFFAKSFKHDVFVNHMLRD